MGNILNKKECTICNEQKLEMFTTKCSNCTEVNVIENGKVKGMILIFVLFVNNLQNKVVVPFSQIINKE